MNLDSIISFQNVSKHFGKVTAVDGAVATLPVVVVDTHAVVATTTLAQVGAWCANIAGACGRRQALAVVVHVVVEAVITCATVVLVGTRIDAEAIAVLVKVATVATCAAVVVGAAARGAVTSRPGGVLDTCTVAHATEAVRVVVTRLADVGCGVGGWRTCGATCAEEVHTFVALTRTVCVGLAGVVTQAIVAVAAVGAV